MQPDTLRIDAHDKRAQHKALAEGYKFIETLHTYEMGLPTNKVFIRPAIPADLPGYDNHRAERAKALALICGPRDTL